MSGKLNWEQDGKDWPHRECSRFIEAGGLRWHVQVAGKGPILLLLHGTGASTHSWRDLIAPLAERFTVVAPDLPGHAFTQAPANERLSLGGMALSLAALLTRLGLNPDFIVGHSAGAAIALRLALDAKEKPRGLIGINAALMPFGGIAAQVFPVMARMLVLNPFVPRFLSWRANDAQAVTRLIDGTGSKLSKAGLQFYRTLFASPDHISSTLAMMAHWSLDGLNSDMRKLDIPFLLLVGEKDKAVPCEDAEKVRRIIPSVKIITVKNTGHLSHEERPDAILHVLLDFTKDIDNGCDIVPTTDIQKRRA
jgi:magnesium chelatase accessory protein